MKIFPINITLAIIYSVGVFLIKGHFAEDFIGAGILLAFIATGHLALLSILSVYFNSNGKLEQGKQTWKSAFWVLYTVSGIFLLSLWVFQPEV